LSGVSQQLEFNTSLDVSLIPVFNVSTEEVVLAEIRSRDSPRKDRNYRKEVWSAGDETYFNHFTDDDRRGSKDQERRIRDMLSIVEGTPSDSDEVKNPAKGPEKSAPLVSKARNFFENQEKPPEPRPVVERKKSKGWKPKPPSQEISKKLVPPVLSPKPVRPPPKPKEPQNQAELVRQALLAQQDTGPVKPELLSKPRSYSEPKQVPYIPPPDCKLPPEKLGYLRHITPEPKQAPSENFHVENVLLKHRTHRGTSRTQSDVPQYSHVLRKTGRRGELGIDDDDDSDVTRIPFNVPLIGVS